MVLLIPQLPAEKGNYYVVDVRVYMYVALKDKSESNKQKKNYITTCTGRVQIMFGADKSSLESVILTLLKRPTHMFCMHNKI